MFPTITTTLLISSSSSESSIPSLISNHSIYLYLKAAIDVLGARLGKSSSALSQQALVLLLGTILSAAPVLALLVGFVAVIWIRAVSHLGGQFQDRMKAMEGDLSSN